MGTSGDFVSVWVTRWCYRSWKRTSEKLGIQQVFDFRSETELRPKNENTRDGLFDGPPGVITTHEPLFSKVEYSPEALARRFAAYAANGFSKTYREILDAGARTGAFKRAFEWVRANPGLHFYFIAVLGRIGQEYLRCLFYCY